MKKLTTLQILLNTFLFIIKLTGGILSGSIGLISDAINSFTDIITSIVVFFTVKISKKKSDKKHIFGHLNAEPIGGFFVGVIVGVTGVEIIKQAFMKLISKEEVFISNIAIYVLFIAIIIKIFMATIFIKKGKELNSPGIHASGIDSRNDVLISLIVLTGIILTRFDLYFFDAFIALLVGVFIIFSGYKIIRKNLIFLMNESPTKEIYDLIKKEIFKIKEVNGFHDLKAHYLGTKLHVEIHIEIDKKTPINKAHKISNRVQNKLESLKEISRAFVHIDPV